MSKDISLLICSMAGLALLALTVLVILIANRKPAELDPTDYGWVLLGDTEEGVLAYHIKEFVLRYLPGEVRWIMYDITSIYGPLFSHSGPLTHEVMENLQSHIERYSHD